MKQVVLDQGLPATAAVILREDGWDAVHVREIEMHEATDLEILDFAARESRVVVTLDRDFPEILAFASANRPSVVLIRQQRLRAAEVATLIKSVWRDQEGTLDQGAVVKVSARHQNPVAASEVTPGPVPCVGKSSWRFPPDGP